MAPQLTPDEDAADSLGSYNDAMRVIGEQVKAGAPVPAFLQSRGNRLPANPLDIKAEQAKADAIIAYAASMKDWPLLEQAIDLKIAQQHEFVGWWEKAVRSAGHQPNISATEIISAARATELTGISPVQVSRWGKRLSDEVKYRAQQLLAAYRKAGLEPDENHRAEGTGDNEWFTPAQYIEAARQVMGAIDLDPASHLIAQMTVRATTFFTAADSGLMRPWHGRVWLNPPYVQPLIAQFIDKLVGEVSARHVEQAILLTHNYTDTAWFHQAEAAADLLCFTRGRIKFIDADGDECAPTQGQAFFYYGPHGDRFREIFGQFGFVR